MQLEDVQDRPKPTEQEDVRCDYLSHVSRICFILFITLYLYLYSYIFIFILYSIYIVLLFVHALFSLLLLR